MTALSHPEWDEKGLKVVNSFLNVSPEFLRFFCEYEYIQRVIECVVKLLQSDVAKSAESWYSVFQ